MKKIKLVFIGVFYGLFITACASEEDKLVAAGEAVYTANCKVCHAQGINGAPVLGNKNNWAPRKDQGIDVLVEHATNGFGLMPPLAVSVVVVFA